MILVKRPSIDVTILYVTYLFILGWESNKPCNSFKYSRKVMEEQHLILFNATYNQKSLFSSKQNKQICCQALSLFLYSLSLRESWHHNHSVPTHQTTTNFLRTLELTYTQVWYIIGIVSSSPTHFHSEKIGLIRVTYDLHCQ